MNLEKLLKRWGIIREEKQLEIEPDKVSANYLVKGWRTYAVRGRLYPTTSDAESAELAYLILAVTKLPYPGATRAINIGREI